MVPAQSNINALADLKGRKLAIAGGPLDKSWLLLQGLARRSDLDLRKQANVVYGAPPLLTEKALQGEIDATLTFWNFCADLESKGFRRAVGMDSVMRALGAKGPVAIVGYVFDSAFAGRNRAAVDRFLSPRSSARKRFSLLPRPNGNGSLHASAYAMARRSRSIASVTAKASCGGRSPRRKRTPVRSTASSPRSVAPSSSDRHASSRPARSTGRPSEPAVALRLVSLALMLAAWYAGSRFAGPRLFPDPESVALAIVNEARSGALAFNLGVTLARVAVSFAIAMLLGTLFGLVMGRSRTADKLGDPWLIVLLNLPALVIIVLAYVWAGLTETAAILAVALNKLPIATVMVREGTRSLDPALDDMAHVFRMSAWTRLRHVVMPQLAPYLAAAARSGLSLVWKIVLIVELLGRPNGVGFEIGVAFQLFDVTRILAYALAFVAVMLAIETFLVQPLERHVARWRPKPA